MYGPLSSVDLGVVFLRFVGQEDKIISMKIGFVHKNMLRGNARTEKCNQLQQSSLIWKDALRNTKKYDISSNFTKRTTSNRTNMDGFAASFCIYKQKLRNRKSKRFFVWHFQEKYATMVSSL